jgi:hypothetical protein
MYAWGNAQADALHRATTILKRADVVIHIRDFINAFRMGIAEYLEEVNKDAKRRQKLLAGTGLWFSELSTGTVDAVLKVHASLP